VHRRTKMEPANSSRVLTPGCVVGGSGSPDGKDQPRGRCRKGRGFHWLQRLAGLLNRTARLVASPAARKRPRSSLLQPTRRATRQSRVERLERSARSSEPSAPSAPRGGHCHGPQTSHAQAACLLPVPSTNCLYYLLCRPSEGPADPESTRPWDRPGPSW
jgi:hypothetical protein